MVYGGRVSTEAGFGRFIDELHKGTNLTLTENQAVTNLSSLDALVDFFALGGAKRDRPQDAVQLFSQAYATDKLTAIRTLFYLRDVRGGQGERAVFRACLKWLAENRQFDTLVKIIPHISNYGRWDDLSFLDYFPGIAGDKIKHTISNQLRRDLAALDPLRGDGQVSLLAKWLPSENATSQHTKAQAHRLRHQLGYNSPRQYRRILSLLRQRIRLLEHDMSTRNWTEIQYDKLPSQAHRRHVKAFHRHTPDRYQAYLDSVQKGEKKINVSAVYPHEIYRMTPNPYADVAWDALPDYTLGENALVMADVSGSMNQPHLPTDPMAVSISLALYFAERNQGAFKNCFMTFSAYPQLVRIQGKTLAEKFHFINGGGRGHSKNTNILAAFRAILDATLRSSGEGCPKVLYIISDMEFDSATGKHQNGQWQVRLGVDSWGRQCYIREWVQQRPEPADTIFETAKREFAEVGLELPHVVFWNVQARQNQAPALAHDGQVSLVSGLSPSIFSQVVGGKTPMELVNDVVNGVRYQPIVL
jgi:hypothetical protein